jgi:tRNA U34 5-carboxymethylaminomethyl modifying GTPase MnmE/TrmE
MASFQGMARYWYPQAVMGSSPTSRIIVVLTQTDVSQAADVAATTHAWAAEHHVRVLETSAKTGKGAQELLQWMVRECQQHPAPRAGVQAPATTFIGSPQAPASRCCCVQM